MSRKVLLIALIILFGIGASAANSASPVSAHASSSILGPSEGIILDRLIKPDGTLDLTKGYKGSFDMRGWIMTTDATGAPHFIRKPYTGANNAKELSPASTPDDVFWDNRFGVPSSGSGADNEVHAIVVSGNNVYAGGCFTQVGAVTAHQVAVWNGSNWSTLGNGPLGASGLGCDYALAVNGTTVYASGQLEYVCGSFVCYSPFIEMWNGSTWSNLGFGLDGYVYALAMIGSSVYAGGDFVNICGNASCNSGNVIVNHIAQWNGSSWSSLGHGVDNYVNSIVPNSDILTDLLVGGSFSNICGNSACSSGNLRANHVAEFFCLIGCLWSSIGNGLDNTVNALAASGTNLYAAGYFVNICGNSACNSGNSTANHVAVWNASSWSSVGNGLDDYVIALTTSGNSVYAGGHFQIACGNPACSSGNTIVTRVAQWNGASWVPLGSGTNSYVYALAITGTQLYAGGIFTSAGNKPSNYFGRWNKQGVFLPLIVR